MKLPYPPRPHCSSYRAVSKASTEQNNHGIIRANAYAAELGGERPYATSRLPTKDRTANIVPTRFQFTPRFSIKYRRAPAPAPSPYKWGLTES